MSTSGKGLNEWEGETDGASQGDEAAGASAAGTSQGDETGSKDRGLRASGCEDSRTSDVFSSSDQTRSNVLVLI